MSGTSIGSADYALCGINPKNIVLLDHWQIRFPKGLNDRLHAAAKGGLDAHKVAQLHHDLGRFYAQGALKGLGKKRVDLAGLHGQTIFHRPDGSAPATFQIGEAAYLAEGLRSAVVSNFRANDLAAGGQGAPLATSFHLKVFARRGAHICVNNLGGISNVTSIDWRAGRPRILSFDTGPANMLLDLATRHCTGGRVGFDRDGKLAAGGEVIPALVRSFLKHPYFKKPPPKSTGREMFGETFLRKFVQDSRRKNVSTHDLLATLVEGTAQSILLNYRLHLTSIPKQIVLVGGGANNPVLVRRLEEIFRAYDPAIDLTSSEKLGWPVESIEAAAFAWLAYQRMRGIAGNLPETTGARRAVLCGQVTLN